MKMSDSAQTKQEEALQQQISAAVPINDQVPIIDIPPNELIRVAMDELVTTRIKEMKPQEDTYKIEDERLEGSGIVYISRDWESRGQHYIPDFEYEYANGQLIGVYEVSTGKTSNMYTYDEQTGRVRLDLDYQGTSISFYFDEQGMRLVQHTLLARETPITVEYRLAQTSSHQSLMDTPFYPIAPLLQFDNPKSVIDTTCALSIKANSQITLNCLFKTLLNPEINARNNMFVPLSKLLPRMEGLFGSRDTRVLDTLIGWSFLRSCEDNSKHYALVDFDMLSKDDGGKVFEYNVDRERMSVEQVDDGMNLVLPVNVEGHPIVAKFHIGKDWRYEIQELLSHGKQGIYDRQLFYDMLIKYYQEYFVKELKRFKSAE